ncbi:hypothetical protein ACGF12_37770 [Kitasatospora sp. NPDC048296]|uniref:hypothetical protein n=1 Tax=Kitasatospora sp. NPDC048296 TaxID=3364048 RepID=UPI003722127D
MLINKNFTLLWFGQALSLVGDYACGTAVLLWATKRIKRDGYGRAGFDLLRRQILLAD